MSWRPIYWPTRHEEDAVGTAGCAGAALLSGQTGNGDSQVGVGQKRTALITGASAGLGAEFARQFAARGYDLVLVARRVDRLHILAEELRSTHVIKVTIWPADLSDPTAPTALVRELGQLQQHIDVLVNNAGSAGPDLLQERDWAVHRRYQELMMTSAVALAHELVPPMVERGYGRVLNVASMAGRIMRGGDTTYGPAKAFLIAHSEALAGSLQGSGVRVMALCPGFVRTEFHTEPELHALRDSIPGWLWYDAQTVVREGLSALERGRVVYVSGRLYRRLDAFTGMRAVRALVRRWRRA